MILVLSLVLGLVPLAGVAWIFVSGMITLVSALGHGGRTFHDADPADALGLLPAQRVLGNARPRNNRQEGNSPGKDSAGESELSDGNPGNDLGAADGARIGGFNAAGIHAMVAGNRALLPPARARRRRAGVAAGVLAGAGLGIRQLLSLRATGPVSSTTWIISIPAR